MSLMRTAAKKVGADINNVAGKFSVYSGKDKLTKELVYIGTTVQKPADRFRWHKANGKDLDFDVLFQFNTEDEMLDKEFELIKQLRPRLNKITHRKQNLNRRLDAAALDLRRGNPEWCQECLKRKKNKGYKNCYYCANSPVGNQHIQILIKKR